MPGNERLTQELAEAVEGDVGGLVVRRFPDDETYVCIASSCVKRDVWLVCSLPYPDENRRPRCRALRSPR